MTKKDISLFFPVYKDEKTVESVAMKAVACLEEIAEKYEIIIVNDASPDRSGEIADLLAKNNPKIRVIHHIENKGYGAAFKAGIIASQYRYICMVDGDDEYDISDLKKMALRMEYYPLVIGFRYKKLYSTKRVFISHIYNSILRLLFKIKFRDISTGIRFFDRKILSDVHLTSDSPFIGAELAIKAMLAGYPVGEIGIQTFPREFGTGSAVSFKNIILTIRDMLKMRREIFSDDYQLPVDRSR